MAVGATRAARGACYDPVVTLGERPWPARIYYDGACPICVTSIARFHRADVHRRLRFTDIAGPDFDPAAVGIDPERIRQAMHARLADGRTVSGPDALLVVAAAIPSLWLLRWLGRVPGFRYIAGPLYRWLARHRYALSAACAHASCTLPER